MPEIKQLPTSVINKIAAGEVIERPASVVKELVENAVDAGARRIDVTVTKGGMEVIRVTDDGCGIAPAQLGLAVSSHATSKIRDADDLFQVMTMGFRGEALASIAEISQFRLRSRQAAETAGAELEVYGGTSSEVAPCGCPVGTTVEVRNLFFNTPVRRKFMRTVQTEMGHISEALTRIALAYCNVHFTLMHNDRVIQDLPATDNWRERITALFGQEISEALIFVESDDAAIESTTGTEPVKIHGYVADPSQSRANNRAQYLFLNRRHIRDRSLGHALGEAYRGLLMVGRYPIAFLQIEMPADAVDVNVHPTKLEVRFRNGGEVYSRLLRMLRTRFLSTDLTAKAQRSQPAVTSPSPPRGNGVAEFKPFADSSVVGPSLSRATPLRQDEPIRRDEPLRQDNLALDFRRSDVTSTTAPDVVMPPAVEPPAVEPPPSTSHTAASDASSRDTFDLHQTGADRPRPLAATCRFTRSAVSAEGTPAMQVYDRYLITETDEGVVVIDQHALHERIIYEDLREKVLSESVEVQKLLVPEPVTLSPSEKAAVMDQTQQLDKLGIQIEDFGGDAVLIAAYPAMLSNINPTELLRGVVDQLLTPETSPERRDLVDGLLHMVSCKAAVKAGDRLTAEEIRTLIERRQSVQDSHHCPHGRPTTLVFSREELDKMFGRTY